MRTNITLEEALAKASKGLQKKMMYSIDLLKKAERLALAYGGVIMAITLPFLAFTSCMLLSTFSYMAL